MVNILFVTYYDFSSNSAIQIHAFANQLVKFGHDCIIAVPNNKDSSYEVIGGDILYTPIDFPRLFRDKYLFRDGHGPDIIHAWTPREVVRKVCVPLVEKYHCKLVIHLEDNEEHVIANYFHNTIQALKSYSRADITALTPERLSHLFFYRDFLDMADGITLIMDTLSEFVPPAKDYTVIWPGVDRPRFNPSQVDTNLKNALGIEEGTLVICYTGNVHRTNYDEVQSLYQALALLNIEGFPTKLIRTGIDHVPFPEDNLKWICEYSINLGFVPHGMIPRILGIADILVQPGKIDNYNKYRLPSKLPEFFSMKKPVILPKVNIGRFIRDRKEGLLLNQGTAMEIAEKIKIILADAALAGTMSQYAGEFAAREFNIELNSRKLESFYRNILEN
ncbi:MAG: D-inositol-3-phosphate glycosyltransferase [Methanoregulaceae archaeon PtaB.Bin009]|jgi:glycosyltransferase involved in cell wall biosynthesis|nr:MAG: D-inositol-3-phosphate glycosyltransferase [Methanoregulaceae archaeon PtaB.Bin009]OPY42328.1 MAG: D-inositol-3-phosphate glycosyltransferase [Methanoregulaceae archaeon PtaU1.Bin066]